MAASGAADRARRSARLAEAPSMAATGAAGADREGEQRANQRERAERTRTRAQDGQRAARGLPHAVCRIAQFAA